MAKKKIKTFKQNTLYKYADNYRIRMTDEEEIKDIDMTGIFLAELDKMIEKGEIIIININAKMRLGKSTLGMAIGMHIYQLLKKYKHVKRTAKFGLKNLARDQQEHSKMMRDPKTQFTVIVTDEANALEDTGENSTAERALEEVFSDVQAGRYVHRVCCSPKQTVDPNADILLSVSSIDEETKTTHAKLYYRYYEGNEEHIQILGYVRISVAEVIKVWDNGAKQLFYKLKKEGLTKKERQQLIRYAKKDWYTFYYIKKHEKMDLITHEGVMKPRTLDYADIIMKIVDSLRKLSKLNTVVNNKVVKNFCKAELEKEKIPYSIVGLQLITDEAMGVLDVWKGYWKVTKDILALDKRINNKKISQNEFTEQNKELLEMRQTLLDTALIQEKRFKKLAGINARYNSATPEEII